MIIMPKLEVFSFHTWAFCELNGVAEMLNEAALDSHRGENETATKLLLPSQILTNFGNLSDKADRDILEGTHGQSFERMLISELIVREQQYEATRSPQAGKVYINAGWVREVFKAHQNGFVRIDKLKCMGETSYEEGCLLRTFPIHGAPGQFFAIVGRKVV